MRSRTSLTLALSALIVCAAQADILWNNYPADSYSTDPAMALSSERDTLVDLSWTVDDAVFDIEVGIEEIRWVGMREDVNLYAYPSADLIILDSDFNEVLLLEDLEYTVLWQSGGPELETYEASVELDSAFPLPAGQYYFGARLAGDPNLGLGRNYIAAANQLNPEGVTGGYFWGPIFGVFDWTPVEDIPFIDEPRDYAFQVHGFVIPEPSTVALLILGGGLFRRRRG